MCIYDKDVNWCSYTLCNEFTIHVHYMCFGRGEHYDNTGRVSMHNSIFQLSCCRLKCSQSERQTVRGENTASAAFPKALQAAY